MTELPSDPFKNAEDFAQRIPPGSLVIVVPSDLLAITLPGFIYVDPRQKVHVLYDINPEDSYSRGFVPFEELQKAPPERIDAAIFLK
ncbi:hypothetical protein A2774_00500 [Candidatus Roizmanbacteria bacterium RIFCSPHIGHO2_01_FULL_39_12c]|uniref:Uncharacterized protein n=1 Tax=Candidatus Roizmanbacteria bacterium RIFCSPHIGHO2_01_FULL_39_12c TaxID=1802031 RepID=A0A1F7G9Z3_9BACT|nr:MAG: hypothetical protein A2774_00500 [Candidatus Roizmanbacteria bacterium RIFCSPHIGHO2_01_FULL_39_12c]OGK46217.1 MAG: hypothetical protein A2963_02000 [Candidatus Roizmanbacteria bacterium RIFCSPLOWO2_01_FULL_40_13]